MGANYLLGAQAGTMVGDMTNKAFNPNAVNNFGYSDMLGNMYERQKYREHGDEMTDRWERDKFERQKQLKLLGQQYDMQKLKNQQDFSKEVNTTAFNREQEAGTTNWSRKKQAIQDEIEFNERVKQEEAKINLMRVMGRDPSTIGDPTMGNPVPGDPTMGNGKIIMGPPTKDDPFPLSFTAPSAMGSPAKGAPRPFTEQLALRLSRADKLAAMVKARQEAAKADMENKKFNSQMDYRSGMLGLRKREVTAKEKNSDAYLKKLNGDNGTDDTNPFSQFKK
jgi:hypothetical protein